MNDLYGPHEKLGDDAWVALNGLIVVLLLVYLGPFVWLLVIRHWLYSQPYETVFEKPIVLVLSIGWFIIVLIGWWIWWVSQLSYTVLIYLWIGALPTVPFIAFVWRRFIVFSKFIKPKSLDESVKAFQENNRKKDTAQSHQARQDQEPVAIQSKLRLGRYLKGDSYIVNTGLGLSNNWVWMDEHLLDQHLFVLGTTGAGKSETLKRLIYEVLASTDRNIYFVDGKGDETLANEVRSLAYHFGRGETPVFRLGFGRNGAIYNGFRGHHSDVYNRLCALVGIGEVEGNATYYADLNRDVLQLVCYAPEGPPRNFEDVRERVSKRWLMRAYKDIPREFRLIEEFEDSTIQSLASRIRPLAREFDQCVGDDGFALEDVKSAIFSMRTQSVGDSANRFINFLMEDIKDFIGKRQKHPSLLVIDEFGQFSNDSIVALLSLARSSNLGIVLATQDVANLRDPRTERLILANTRTKILMATDFPEEVATLAGTIFRMETSIQHEDGQPTGLGSSRAQHNFRVDMNEVAGLQPGEAFIIRQRLASKILVRPIGEVNLIHEQPEGKRQIDRNGGLTQDKKNAPSKAKKPRRKKRTL